MTFLAAKRWLNGHSIASAPFRGILTAHFELSDQWCAALPTLVPIPVFGLWPVFSSLRIVVLVLPCYLLIVRCKPFPCPPRFPRTAFVTNVASFPRILGRAGNIKAIFHIQGVRYQSIKGSSRFTHKAPVSASSPI